MDEAMRGDQRLSRGWYEGFWALLRFLAFFGYSLDACIGDLETIETFQNNYHKKCHLNLR